MKDVLESLFQSFHDWEAQGDERKRAINVRKEYWRSISDAERAVFPRMIDLAREKRADLAEEYAKPVFDEDQHEMVSDIAETCNAKHLLDCMSTRGDEPIQVRKRFEAMSLFDMARAMTQIELRDSEFEVSEDMTAMVNLILEELFERSQRLDIWSYHDSDNSYRVRELAVGSQIPVTDLHEIHHRPITRVTPDGMHVLFHHRRKKLFRVLLKLVKWHRDTHDHPFRLTDRCGMTLIAQTLQQARRLRARVEDLITENGGTFRVDHSNLEVSERMDRNNPHSSAHFRACKCLFEWQGRTFELMLMLFRGHYNAKYSTGSENHDIYRINQMLDVYLPFLYPESVYGIGWSDGSARKLVKQDVIQRVTQELMR